MSERVEQIAHKRYLIFQFVLFVTTIFKKCPKILRAKMPFPVTELVMPGSTVEVLACLQTISEYSQKFETAFLMPPLKTSN